MKQCENRKRGFTLVELIVALVILAILAAILIPSMVGWIKRAEEKRLLVACRSCVLAAQTLAIENYGAGRADAVPDADEVETLAGVPGEVSDIGLALSSITKLTYTEGGAYMTYTRDPVPTFAYNGVVKNGGPLPSVDPTGTLNTVLLDWNSISGMDSQAALYAGTDATAALSELANMGIDLTALGAKSWVYQKDGSGAMLDWTTYDIGGLDEGTIVPVIRYRPNGVYSLWEYKVVTHDTGKKDPVTGDPIIVNAIRTTGKQLFPELTEAQKKNYTTVRDKYDSVVDNYS